MLNFYCFIILWPDQMVSTTIFLNTSFQPSSFLLHLRHSISLFCSLPHFVVFLTTVFYHAFPLPSVWWVFYCFPTPFSPSAKNKKGEEMPNKTPHTLGTAIIFAVIVFLTVLDMRMERIQPCIYHVNMDWWPAGRVPLLLDVHMLPVTKEPTHMVGCSLDAITMTMINTMMNQLTIIFGFCSLQRWVHSKFAKWIVKLVCDYFEFVISFQDMKI